MAVQKRQTLDTVILSSFILNLLFIINQLHLKIFKSLGKIVHNLNQLYGLDYSFENSMPMLWVAIENSFSKEKKIVRILGGIFTVNRTRVCVLIFQLIFRLSYSNCQKYHMGGKTRHRDRYNNVMTT